jgi:hypothetical protein
MIMNMSKRLGYKMHNILHGQKSNKNQKYLMQIGVVITQLRRYLYQVSMVILFVFVS